LLRLASLLLMTLAFAAIVAAQSVPFPTYQVGQNQNSTQGPNYPSTLSYPWVASNGQILTPVGIPVYLGTTTRAKAIALNPITATHTAAVLQMGANQAVSIFDTHTGVVLQTYTPAAGNDPDGSNLGITYTPDGKYLLFSQDGNSYYDTLQQGAFVAIAAVDPTTGMLSDYAQVPVLMDVDTTGKLTTVNCFSNSPGGTTGSFYIPCGYTNSQFADQVFTAYPTGIAVSSDAKTAYVVLDNNNTLTKLDLTTTPPTQVAEIRVGNVPHSVVISPDGKTAYVSNEAGRIATANNFQEYSNGTPVVADYNGSTKAGTVSVVDLSQFKVTGTIETGLHPTGMAFWGKYLLVANAYSDTLSVIDTSMMTVGKDCPQQAVRTINLGLPISVPGEWEPAYGAAPNSIAVDAKRGVAYVALYNANAIAVVDLTEERCEKAVQGLIPVGYAPSSVVLDTPDGSLLVANDKGIGSTGFAVAPPPTATAENSYGSHFGVTYFNTHEDLGTASIIPLPDCGETLAKLTKQVYQNNHWDLWQNIQSAGGGSKWAKPLAIPAKIGDPSSIKHVFVIIRENRSYDQMLGDVAGGNGDPSLAVFGDNSTYAEYPVVTPNAHALVQRFPLLDNFYDPSRQSADGHNWIVQAMAPYSDDIQSPDFLRDYPSNGGDAIAYQKKGFLWDQAAKAGVSFKNYGEYVEYNTFTVPGCTLTNITQDNYYNGGYPGPLPFLVSDSCEPSWTQFYNDTLEYESGNEAQLQYFNTIGSASPLPGLIKHTVQNYPQFDLGIPDQYRVDVWKQDFAKDLADGTVPQLEFLWIMSDHTTGPPNATAEQADNDLAVGRVIDIISHSSVWNTSAIFIEEDDAQNGVDHVDGHRSPGYIVSPFVLQKVNQDGTGAGVTEDSTFYTQVNMTRTIEQILGIAPMNQFDLTASPMRTLFVDNPPQSNFLPWTHVANQVPLCYGVEGYVPPSDIPPSFNTCNSTTTTAAAALQHDNAKVEALRAGWMKMKAEVFATKYHTPDTLDPDTVSHYDWYDATGYKVPFPGEKTVRPASDFASKAVAASGDTDDDD